MTERGKLAAGETFKAYSVVVKEGGKSEFNLRGSSSFQGAKGRGCISQTSCDGEGKKNLEKETFVYRSGLYETTDLKHHSLSGQ